MLKNDKFYENLGTYYSISNEISEKINSKLFNDFKLNIKVLGINPPLDDLSSIYRIEKIEVLSIDDNHDSINFKLASKINKINEYLNTTDKKKLGYKNETYSWSLFYLFKEMITLFQKQGYNYYRGQNEDWETVPGIFRNLKNNDGSKFYDEFEGLYLDISREFPDDVKYIPLVPEKIEDRADELSVLQHYGLPTSLLDISENPFIAMLFMLGFGKIKKPQLEFYKIDSVEHTEKSLVSFVHKKVSNKRIKAQKGAFINFDKLVNFINFQKNEIKLKGYKPIDRIIIQIEFDKRGTVDYLKQQRESKLSYENEECSDQTINLSNKELDALIKLIEDEKNDKIIDLYYDLIQKELLKKLKEFNYETNDLFPDFADYLDYKSKEFKPVEYDNKLLLKALQGSQTEATNCK